MSQGMSILLSFVFLSFLLELFLGLADLFFSETQRDVRGSCGVVCDSDRLLGKNFSPPPKMEKIGQNWAK